MTILWNHRFCKDAVDLHVWTTRHLQLDSFLLLLSSCCLPVLPQKTWTIHKKWIMFGLLLQFYSTLLSPVRPCVCVCVSEPATQFHPPEETVILRCPESHTSPSQMMMTTVRFNRTNRPLLSDCSHFRACISQSHVVTLQLIITGIRRSSPLISQFS